MLAKHWNTKSDQPGNIEIWYSFCFFRFVFALFCLFCLYSNALCGSLHNIQKESKQT